MAPLGYRRHRFPPECVNQRRTGTLRDSARFDAWLRFVAIERGAALLRPAKLAAIERDGEGWRVSLMTRDGPVGLTAAFVIDSGGRAAPLARRLGAVRRPLGDRLVCGWVYGEARTNADDAGFSTVEAVEDGWWYTAPLPGQRRALTYFTDADLPAAQLAHDRGMLVASATATARFSAATAPAGPAPTMRMSTSITSPQRRSP